MHGDDEKDAPGLDSEQLKQIEGEIFQQEEESRESILGSAVDFELWMTSHPSLRQIVMVENFSDILPSILNFFRAMLGFQIPEQPGEEPQSDQDDEDGDAQA